MAKYSEEFKMEVEYLRRQLAEKGFVLIENVKVNNVRQLVNRVGITNHSLYAWKKEFDGVNVKQNGTMKKLPEITLNKLKDELEEIITEGMINDSNGKGNNGKAKFGITFWMFLAENLGLPSRTNKAQLLNAIGLHLIKESGLVRTKAVKEMRL